MATSKIPKYVSNDENYLQKISVNKNSSVSFTLRDYVAFLFCYVSDSANDYFIKAVSMSNVSHVAGNATGYSVTVNDNVVTITNNKNYNIGVFMMGRIQL